MKMDRRGLLAAAAGAALCAMVDHPDRPVGLKSPLPPVLKVTSAKRALYERSIVIDALADPGVTDPSKGTGQSAHEIFKQAQQSGITAINLTINDVDLQSCIKFMKEYDAIISRNSDLIIPVRNYADFHRAVVSRGVV